MTAAPQSEAERVAQLSDEDFEKWLKDQKPEKLWEREYDWPFWARTDQYPPLGDWRTWFVMAGRGFGKTRMSAMPRWQVTMRKREGIDLRTRLVWRGRFLGVRTIVSDPRDPARMVLTCEEAR